VKIPFEGSLKRKDIREAADTGLLLWRNNFIYFVPFFAVPFWICAFSVRLFPDFPLFWPWFIIWLLKPFFDRLILHVISIRFFESGAGIKRLCRGLAKNLRCCLAGDLLWRRFSPLRAVMIPVRILEENFKTGTKIAERKKNLKKGGIKYCSLLSFWGVAVEITLLFGETFFFMIMADLFSNGLTFDLFNSSDNVEIFLYTAWCINYMLIETIYVCMGFSLYINSRTIVEGWDIEIIFRKFAGKYKNKLINGVLIIFLTSLFFPVKTYSGDLELFTAPDAVYIEELKDILNSPEFGGEQDTWGIRFKNQEKDKSIDFSKINLNPCAEKIRSIFAYFLQFILFSLLMATLLFLFYFIIKFKKQKFAGTNVHKTTETLYNNPMENPELLLEKALIFYKHGEKRLAWGYCAAAAIISLQLYRGFTFPPNATESECINIVNSKTANKNPAKREICNIHEIKTFSGIIKHWVYFAYAGRIPPDGSFEEAAVFCKSLGAANV